MAKIGLIYIMGFFIFLGWNIFTIDPPTWDIVWIAIAWPALLTVVAIVIVVKSWEELQKLYLRWRSHDE